MLLWRLPFLFSLPALGNRFDKRRRRRKIAASAPFCVLVSRLAMKEFLRFCCWTNSLSKMSKFPPDVAGVGGEQKNLGLSGIVCKHHLAMNFKLAPSPKAVRGFPTLSLSLSLSLCCAFLLWDNGNGLQGQKTAFSTRPVWKSTATALAWRNLGHGKSGRRN